MRFTGITTPRAALRIALCLGAIPLSFGCGAAKAPRPVAEVSDGREKAGTEAAPGKPAGQEGIYHRLKSGQTLGALARIYQVPVDRLMQANGITDPTAIPAHTLIFVPGATRAVTRKAPGGAVLAWPIRGRITTRFNLGGTGRYHQGIDIDGELGQPIRAAAAGTVVEAQSDGRYGESVLIDHGGGLMTFYAHASKLLVHSGERVEQGETIAEVGSSGNARGTHLHFETRSNGRPVNPFKYLRDRPVLAKATH